MTKSQLCEMQTFAVNMLMAINSKLEENTVSEITIFSGDHLMKLDTGEEAMLIRYDCAKLMREAIRKDTIGILNDIYQKYIFKDGIIWETGEIIILFRRKA